MRAEEVDIAIGWAEAEGWNPGRGDRDPFMAEDPAGFLMGFVDGEPATSISVVRYGDRFGFLGFYICRPEWRGRGLGWRTWQAGMARLEGLTVGLDGVVAQQENYRRSGFALAHRNIRYGGVVDVRMPDDPGLAFVRTEFESAVAAFDRDLFPAARSRFLNLWLDQRQGRRAIALRRDGAVKGYGVIRSAASGHKIGPLFAASEPDADLLFRALAAQAFGEPLFIDPPEPNAAAIRLAERYGLAPAFETARMYRGPAPALPLDRIFGITSFELG